MDFPYWMCVGNSILVMLLLGNGHVQEKMRDYLMDGHWNS